MKHFLIMTLVITSFSAFAKEFVFYQSGISNNKLMTVFSHCSSDINQLVKWHKKLNSLQFFEKKLSTATLIFNASDECSDYVSNLIQNKNALEFEGVFVDGQVQDNKMVHDAIGALEVAGAIGK